MPILLSSSDNFISVSSDTIYYIKKIITHLFCLSTLILFLLHFFGSCAIIQKQGSETMTSFENIYYTKEYQSQRNDYLSGIIVPENKGETEKIPLDAGFFLLSTEYILKKQGNISKTAYEQSLLSPDGTKLHSWQIADSHDFTDFSAIFAHSDSRLYFIYKDLFVSF